jgi:predicted  nucleic acid-binding Zn-ribbon protein
MAKKKAIKKQSGKSSKPQRKTAAQRRAEMPATQGMLIEMRKELGHKVTSVDLKIDAVNKNLSGRIDSLDKRLTGRIDSVEKKLTGRIDSVEKKLTGRIDSVEKNLSAKMERMHADIHRVLYLVEEQHAENRTVWDKQAALEVRQDRLEEEVKDIRQTVDNLAKVP